MFVRFRNYTVIPILIQSDFTQNSIVWQTLLYVNVSLLYSLPSTQFNGYKNILRKIAAAQLMDIYTSKDICHKCYSYIYIPLICVHTGKAYILYLKMRMHVCIAKQNHHTIFHPTYTSIGISQRRFFYYLE